MHEAYSISSVFDAKRIESIAAYENNIIIGTQLGQIYIYSMEKRDSKMVRKHENYHDQTLNKKPIYQMKVVPEENLLFVLSYNGVINVYNICNKNITLIQRCVETKDCTVFDVDVKTRISSSGKAVTSISLCVGIKNSLRFFCWLSDELQPLSKEIPLKDEPKAICWKDSIICIGFKDEYVIYNITSQVPEKHDLIETSAWENINPCVSLIKNSMFGITKDNFLVFIDPNRFTKNKKKLLKKIPKPIKWGSSVFDLVCDGPFLIGQTAKGLEVRVIEAWGPEHNNTFIQTLNLGETVKFLARSDSGQIFAASTSKIWYIQMNDIASQKTILLSQKKFKLAIELTNLSNETEPSKAEEIRDMRIAYAKDLFINKKFSKAMEEFKNVNAYPFDVIFLFPESITGELKKKVESSLSQANMPELRDKELEVAILALIGFLADARQKEIYKLSQIKGSSKSSLLTFIDTTMLKCYLQTNDSLIGPLLRLKQCDFDESEKTLQKHQKFCELIILYQLNGKHEKALNFLKKQAFVENSSLFGHEKTVKYLQELGNDQKNLVFTFSKWVLKKHPEDGLKIFTNASEELEYNTIPAEEVLDFLSRNSENLVLPYLEHIVHVSNDPSPTYHNLLIKSYIGNIKQLRLLRKIKVQKVESYRRKLNEFLRKSDNYSPEVVLQEFPSDYLFDERILVLARMKEHTKVLVILIQIQGNVEKAFEYCEDVYNEDKNIFEVLLKVLIHPLESSPYNGVELHKDFLKPNIEVVVELLNKKASKMNPATVLPLLPGDLPMHRIKTYMEIVSQLNMEKKFHFAIVKNMLHAEILRLKGKLLMHQRDNFVKLTETSVCKKCYKRFVNQQVFKRNPNGDVVHLSCSNDKV